METLIASFTPFVITDHFSTYWSEVKLSVSGKKIEAERFSRRIIHDSVRPDPAQVERFELDLPYDCHVIVESPGFTIVSPIRFRHISARGVIFFGKPGEIETDQIMVLFPLFFFRGSDIFPKIGFSLL